MNMNRARTTLATLVFVVAAAVSVLANYTHSFWMDGNNDPRAANYLGFSAHGSISADPVWYGYPSGPTFVKVRLDGHTPSCGSGSWREGEWCADNAHPTGFGGWASNASAHVNNIVPFGCYTATIMAWVNENNMVENYPTAKCFDDPPPSIPGDGYCVTYDYDPGQGAYVCNTSPILIDTGGKKARYVLSPPTVPLFDIDGDGLLDAISWTLPNSTVAFLALDRNGNGTIDDGTELFGGKTLKGASNGFSALRKMSGANFGYVDATHGGELYYKLLLWHDVNANGVSEPDELKPASETLEAVGLGYQMSKDRDAHGNIFAQKSFARFQPVPGRSKAVNTHQAPEREFTIYDVSFATK